MSAIFELVAQKRTTIGRRASSTLRTQKQIPAVLYGHHGNFLLQMNEEKTRHFLDQLTSAHQLLPLKIEENNSVSERYVLIKEVQRHAYKDFIHHIDFLELDPQQTVVVRVPLKLVGEAVGIKEGGSIQIVVRTVPIRCLPNEIPDFIEVDVTKMMLNSYLRVKELVYPENVTSCAGQNFAVVTLRGRAKTQTPQKS